MISYPYRSPPELQQPPPPEIIILEDGAEVAKRQQKRKRNVFLVLVIALTIGIIVGVAYTGYGGRHRHYTSTNSVPGKRAPSSEVGMGLICFAAGPTPTSFGTDSDYSASGGVWKPPV